MKYVPSKKEIQALALRVMDVVDRSPLGGIHAARALMSATFYAARRAGLTGNDIVDWLRRLADELDQAERRAREEFGARTRALLRKSLDR
jgi:hypothetical protein